ncbi:hypothetical protein [Jeotgalibaca porci]
MDLYIPDVLKQDEGTEDYDQVIAIAEEYASSTEGAEEDYSQFSTQVTI